MGHEHIETTMKYADALGAEAMIEDHRRASPVEALLGKNAAGRPAGQNYRRWMSPPPQRGR